MGKACKEKVVAYFKVKWWYLTGRLETSLSGLRVSGPIFKTGTLT
jgi:predicted secreted hydrolase